MTLLANIADRALNRPLLITPAKAQVLLAVLGERIGVNTPDASRFEGEWYEESADGKAGKWLPYSVTDDGVAIISIVGSLVARGAWIGAYSGLVSYEGIQHQIKEAWASPKVRAVILDLHTPGGEAIGAFETATMVRDMAADKPVVAVVNGMAASAGYAIGSGATEIVTTPTGISGSIGVVLLHADFSKQLADDGIDPTLIFAGAHKVDGNPFEPLPDDVKADLQAEVEAVYDQFIATVAAGRGDRLSAEAARATEARTRAGQAAVEAGLADRVGTFESVLAELSRAAGASSKPQRRSFMTQDTQAGATPGISQADHDKAVADARAEGRAEGLSEGAMAERDRITAIMGTEGIAGNAARMAAALNLAADAPDLAAEKVAEHASAVAPDALTSNGPDPSLANRQNLPDSLATTSGEQGGKQPSGLSKLVDAQVERMNARA